MQYLLLPDRHHRYFLADRNERIALNEGITQTLDLDDSDRSLRLLYGVYKPQIDTPFTFADIEHHIHDALGQTLLHIQHTTVMTLRIVSIVLSDRPISHTQDRAFAALTEVPNTFSTSPHVRTAFLQEHDNVIQALKHRKGVFMFSGEEKAGNTPLTKRNWRGRINHLRLLNETERVLPVLPKEK